MKMTKPGIHVLQGLAMQPLPYALITRSPWTVPEHGRSLPVLPGKQEVTRCGAAQISKEWLPHGSHNRHLCISGSHNRHSAHCPYAAKCDIVLYTRRSERIGAGFGQQSIRNRLSFCSAALFNRYRSVSLRIQFFKTTGQFLFTCTGTVTGQCKLQPVILSLVRSFGWQQSKRSNCHPIGKHIIDHVSFLGSVLGT